MSQALAVGAAHVEADAVYNLLVSNPSMPDGQKFFAAPHGNLMPATALDATSLAAACATLATISTHGRPAFLVVGTKDGPTARTLIAQETPLGADAATAGLLQVVVDDRIASGWYVATSPAERPAFATAHLAGVEQPELLVQDGWDVDARLYKGRDTFGVAALDPYAMVLTPAP